MTDAQKQSIAHETHLEPWDDRAITEVVMSLRMGEGLSRKAKADIADLIMWLRSLAHETRLMSEPVAWRDDGGSPPMTVTDEMVEAGLVQAAHERGLEAAAGEYERQEAICAEAAMSQWERSLKRPDLSEKDRVRGAIEAYKRQAFAFTVAPRPPESQVVGVDTSILRERISRAIFDPGETEGYKGDRTLTDWQTDAVMRVLGFPSPLQPADDPAARKGTNE